LSQIVGAICLPGVRNPAQQFRIALQLRFAGFEIERDLMALGLDANTKILIGVGTSICGGSAIAATAPVIEADDKEVAFAISTIFLFNIIAVFVFPALGHLMKMSDDQFGLWAGTAINDTSSVVAAAFSYSDSAGRYATIVKLTRTLMIIPVTLVLAFSRKRGAGKNAGSVELGKIFPWFVLGFLAARDAIRASIEGEVLPAAAEPPTPSPSQRNSAPPSRKGLPRSLPRGSPRARESRSSLSTKASTP